MEENQQPKIADTKPKAVQLKKGEEKFWCACGRSNNQPFCDGSHRDTGFEPVGFTPEKTEEAYLCMCKCTSNPPYCDGTHNSLSEEEKDDKAEEKQNENIKEEPTLTYVKKLASGDLGNHGEIGAMGVPKNQLPKWDDIQLLTAQLAKKPLAENTEFSTELIIGPNAKKPLKLDIPLFVSDMSFGALSEEAKIALAKGAEMAGTGIASGEGGMLAEEQVENSRYFYEYATGAFGFEWEKLRKVQAFHFKGGQATKTGTGGHLPGSKVTSKIAETRNLKEGEDAISPATFKDLSSVEDFKKFGDKVREVTGGVPIGFKLSANHIEKDIQFALDAGADYIILDGRGGGTGASPLLFRNHISVPTIPALARARQYLNRQKRNDVTLIITGGLRVPEDFIKALALGADGIAVANSAIQSIGCVAARICHTNNCPSGIATQNPELRKKIDIAKSANQLKNFFNESVKLMKVMARACGHNELQKFDKSDLTTWKKEMAELTGISFGGVRH
ncbi:glutamate synthase-related protein [Jiulongibacter sediminis]|uniref:Glutamate synthase n=1 Tax=Jiulongibacter sediminis TaxID=1605367 RepID=A0A0P7C0I4_9BACT|nr:glutamate synthase-related protein [Jiulongibacter sediminis]KPM48086.1 glutamate synthase [Jiulongibacter sediminis]TBX24266.1 glutamate synthase [Jiulongibacter sediminis]